MAHDLPHCTTTEAEKPKRLLWQWQETSFSNSKRSQSTHQSMEICLASALATESTSRFCSWQAGINGKNLLLHEAVPQRTDAQSHCPSPDLDGLHLGGESTTVINSCWFNKLHNWLQSRPHWSSTQKRVSFRNFPKLCFTETEGR